MSVTYILDGKFQENYSPFNSSFECGIRLLCILEAAYPSKIDMEYLIYFDHFIVHTGDLDGPKSLHPAAPGYAKELVVRRELIQNGLTLMLRKGLIVCCVEATGFKYQASEKLPAFLNVMKESYSKKLKNRANWLVSRFLNIERDEFKKIVSDHIDLWVLEIKSSERYMIGQ